MLHAARDHRAGQAGGRAVQASRGARRRTCLHNLPRAPAKLRGVSVCLAPRLRHRRSARPKWR